MIPRLKFFKSTSSLLSEKCMVPRTVVENMRGTSTPAESVIQKSFFLNFCIHRCNDCSTLVFYMHGVLATGTCGINREN